MLEREMLEREKQYRDIYEKIKMKGRDLEESEIKMATEIYEEIKMKSETYGELREKIKRITRELRYEKANSKMPMLLEDTLYKDLDDLPLTSHPKD